MSAVEISQGALARVLRAAGLVGALTLVARGATVLREAVVAAEIGPTAELDALLIGYAVPLFLIAALQNTLGAAWSPSFVAVAANRSELRVRVGYAQGVTLVAALLAAGFFAAAAPFLVPSLAVGLAAPEAALAARLGLLLAALVPLQGLAFVWTAALQAQGRFALPAIAPVVTPGAGIAVLTLADDPGVAALAFALLAGAILEIAILGAALVRARALAWPTLRRPSGVAVETSMRFGSLAVGSVLIGTVPLADQLIAGAAGAGGVAHFAFAARVTGLVAGIANLAISQAALPVLTSASSDKAAFARLSRGLVLIVVVAGAVAAISIAALSGPIVAVLFRRGAFGQEDAAVVAAAQAIYALQLPFYLGWLVVCRAAASVGRTRFALLSSGLVAMLNVGLNVLLVDGWGVAGVCAATAFSFSVAFVIALIVLRGVSTPKIARERKWKL